MAVALMVPFTFFLDPISALALMIAVGASSIYAGDIPARTFAYTIPRFTFGQISLLQGVNFIPAMIGLFAISGAIEYYRDKISGSWIPSLVFGIPGDSAAAIIIGVLYMKDMNLFLFGCRVARTQYLPFI